MRPVNGCLASVVPYCSTKYLSLSLAEWPALKTLKFWWSKNQENSNFTLGHVLFICAESGKVPSSPPRFLHTVWWRQKAKNNHDLSEHNKETSVFPKGIGMVTLQEVWKQDITSIDQQLYKSVEINVCPGAVNIFYGFTLLPHAFCCWEVNSLFVFLAFHLIQIGRCKHVVYCPFGFTA